MLVPACARRCFDDGYLIAWRVRGGVTLVLEKLGDGAVRRSNGKCRLEIPRVSSRAQGTLKVPGADGLSKSIPPPLICILRRNDRRGATDGEVFAGNVPVL